MARFHATRQCQYLLDAINDIALYSFSQLHPGHRMLYEDWVGFDPSSGIRILRLLKVRETNQYYHLAEIVVRTMSALVCHALGVDIREFGATHLEYSQYQLYLSKVLARCEDEATTISHFRQDVSGVAPVVFSGHGLLQGVALGRSLCGFIVYSQFPRVGCIAPVLVSMSHSMLSPHRSLSSVSSLQYLMRR